MTSVWSFGEDSPIKFEIPDKMATSYNEALQEFMNAQRRFTQKWGKAWNGEPIDMNWTRRQRKAWNQFADLFNAKIKAEGPFHQNDIVEDFLVKNTAGAVASGAGGFGRALVPIAVAGALYGVLRGLK